MRKTIVTVGVLTITAALGLAGMAALKQVEARRLEAAATEIVDQGVEVAVVAAVKRTVAFDVAVSGFLQPFEQLTLSAEVPGFVKRQHAEVSDHVVKGQTVFEIDASLREVELAKAQAAAARARSELELATEDVRRVERLQAQESANPREVKQVTTAFDTARAMLDQAEAAVEEARILLDKTIIRAPIDGYVAAVHTRQGEFAHAGQPLLDLIDTDRLKLIVQLSDRRVVAFDPGDPVRMRAPARPAETFDGRILRIHPRAAIDSHMFEIEIEVSNPEQLLRPGFFVEATLSQQKSAARQERDMEVLTIPRAAVFERFRQQYCFVVRPADGGSQERAYLTMVETIPFPADMKWVQVVSGVQAGDRVVTTGLQHVTHEAAVQVVQE